MYQRDDILDDTDRQMLETDKANLATYRSALQGFAAKVRADHNGAQAMLLAGAVRDACTKLRTAIDSQIAYNDKLGHDLSDANDEAYSRAFCLLVSCITLALLVSGGSGVQLYRSITSGLNSIQQALRQVSQSLDLTHTPKVERMNEISHTATAFNALLARVAEVVGEVRRSISSVSVASK